MPGKAYEDNSARLKAVQFWRQLRNNQLHLLVGYTELSFPVLPVNDFRDSLPRGSPHWGWATTKYKYLSAP